MVHFDIKGWSQDDVKSQIVSSFLRTPGIQNTLETGASKVVNDDIFKTIPSLTTDNLFFDRVKRELHISLDVDIHEHSASSIGPMKDLVITSEQLRTFIHDFTFYIIEGSTDVKLKTVFPSVEDGHDSKTPDSIINTQDAVIVLEFTTNQSNSRISAVRDYASKKDKYERMIMNRISKIRKSGLSHKRYGFFPIVVSPNFLVVPACYDPDPQLVAELTARMRFATGLMSMLVDIGYIMEDNPMSQLKTDILAIIKDIKPEYQEDGECKVPLTEKRVVTKDLDPSECMAFANKEYLKSLRHGKSRVGSRGTPAEVSNVYSKLLQSNLGTRSDLKSILNVPNCIPQPSSDWAPEICSDPNEMESFLNEIILETQTPEWNYHDSEEEQVRKALLTGVDVDSKIESQTRRKYKRVSVSMKESTRILFASLGVQGKEFSKNPEVVQRRLEKKESFSLNVNTKDIESIVVDPPPLDDLKSTPGDFHLSWQGISKAMEMNDDLRSDESDLIKQISQSSMYHWLSFCSAIGVELSISLKQNVRKDEWVVKKMRHWDAYLVIKPTKSDSHIFYSVILPKNTKELFGGNICNNLQYTDKYVYTSWVSYTLSKIVNLIKCDVFYMSMIGQWLRHFQLEIRKESLNKQVLGMSNLCLLVHMEDRPKTEEIMTLLRYVCMEKFSMVKSNPNKIIPKIPEVLRSRLQVWTVNRLVYSMCSPLYEPDSEQTLEDADGSDGESKKDSLTRRWRNLENPYLKQPLDRPQQLIELFYIGYATNKDAKTWQNAEFDLIKKIVKYEKELDLVRSDCCGLGGDPGDGYRFHEWSRHMVCASADYVKSFLKNVGGNGGDLEGLTEKIIHRLATKTWEDVATLKASSTFDPWNLEKGESKSTETRRIKVVLAILKQWGQIKETPALSIGVVLEWVDKDGGLRVDLFKKNQHGGLREIYVLEIHSRLLQLVLEEISRAICAELPIEMMMHPESKVSKPQEHMYRSAKEPSKYKYNVSSSNDAKVWNQGHHVAKFAQFLVRLLPEEFHGLIVNGLKQWVKKRILLPTGVLNQLMRNGKEPLYDPIHNEIRLAYLGIKETKWLKAGKPYLDIESGMMQGILHYTSSAFHAAFLMLRDCQWHWIARTLAIKSTTIDLVSSDDSSRMTDVFAKTKETLRISRQLAFLDHLAIEKLSPYMGIWMSEKSTMCTNGVMEFNSEFFFRASHYRPTLKWSYASLGVVEVESLLERQEVLYNQLTELLEGGSGFKQAHLTQICQGLLHYKLMGSSVHNLFYRYIGSLRSRPDPALGFFLMDPKLIAGLPGLNYSVWNIVKKSDNVSRIYSSLLKQGEMTTTTTGMLTRGCQIRFGNRKKTKKLLEEAESIMPNWRETIEEDPSVLYLVARDLKTSAIKILSKLTSPSVIRSLSQTNSLARMMAASNYLITGIATTLGSNWSATLKDLENEDIKKVSLWRLLFMDLPNYPQLTKDEMKLLFPQADHYSILSTLVKNLQDYHLIRGGSQKMLRSQIQIFPEVHTALLPLETVVKAKWFNERVNASKAVLDHTWSVWKSHLPWLKDDPIDTIKNPDCHFEGQIQLRNFIARQANKSRVVHLTGTPVKDDKHKDVLLSSILKNQAMGFTLSSDREYLISQKPFTSLQSQVASILSFPLLNSCRKEMITRLMIDSDDLWELGKGIPDRRKYQLHIIQRCLKIIHKGKQSSPIKSIELRNIIADSKLGVIGGFKKRQTGSYNDYHGEGIWIGRVGSAIVQLKIKDSTLEGIWTDNLLELRDNCALLNNLCREFGLDSLGTSFVYDLKYDFRDFSKTGLGCPVYQTKDLTLAITDLTIDIRCSDNNLRLVANPEGSGEFTILSYRTKSFDFSFLHSVKLPKGNYFLNQWINNESVDPDLASDLISKILNQVPSKRFDMVKLKEFAKDSLLHTLAKKGWSFRKSWKDDLVHLTQPVDMKIIDVMTDFDDFDFSTIDLEEILEEIDDQDTINYCELEFEIHDFLIGDIGAMYSNDVTNINRYHNFWSAYIEEKTNQFSPKQKSMLESGLMIRAHPDEVFINMLKNICGLTLRVNETEDVHSPDLYNIEEEF